MRKARQILGTFAACCLLTWAADAAAQIAGMPAPGYRQDPGLVASTLPKPLREIGFDQNVNQRLPLDVDMTDESARRVRLADYFGSRPVVLAFVYYQCPMLCGQVIGALASTLGVLSQDAGRDFEVVVVSFDPRETPAAAAEKKTLALERYKRPETDNGWHFLTGDQPAIHRLAEGAGFRYVWDEETKQFAHPTGIIVLTPDGTLARYLFGIDYGPRDLRFALIEASKGAVGSAVDSLLLYCYHYDPMTGRYGVAIMRTLRLAAAVTVAALASFIFIMVHRDRPTTCF
jgi:protein SCO1/2